MGPFRKDFRKSVYGNILDFGVKVRPGKFKVNHCGCEIPHMLAFAYALAFSYRAGGDPIYLAGFEGYKSGDPRQEEMIEVINLFNKMIGIPLIAITPTNYPVEQASVYAPFLP